MYLTLYMYSTLVEAGSVSSPSLVAVSITSGRAQVVSTGWVHWQLLWCTVLQLNCTSAALVKFKFKFR